MNKTTEIVKRALAYVEQTAQFIPEMLDDEGIAVAALLRALDDHIANTDKMVHGYDFSNVIHLTHHKAQHIIERDGYALTGFVLTKNKEGREYAKCIVDMSAVRWFDDGMTFFRMMHAPTPKEWLHAPGKDSINTRSASEYSEPVKQEPVAHYKDAPHTIYLQTGCDDPEDCECSFNEWGDTTWCADQIHDTDIPYIRADYAAPVDAKAIREQALEEAAKVCDNAIETTKEAKKMLDASEFMEHGVSAGAIYQAEKLAAAIRGLK